MPHPAYSLYTMYTMNPTEGTYTLYQVEDWRLVSMPHPDYALMLWCGQLPVLDYSGGILISRHRQEAEILVTNQWLREMTLS
jgi:hypothetical protein